MVLFCVMAGVLGACVSRFACRTRCAVDCVDPAADLECPRPLKCAKLDAGVGLSSLGLGPQSAHAESTHAFESMQLDADAGPPLSVSTEGIEAMLSDGDLTLLAQVYLQLGTMHLEVANLAAGAQPDACMTPSDVGALVLLVLTNAGPSQPVLCNRDGTPPTRLQLVSMLLAAKRELFKMHAHACGQDATDAQLEIITTAIAKITAVVGRLVPTLSTPGLVCRGGGSEAAAGGSEVASAGTNAASDDKVSNVWASTQECEAGCGGCAMEGITWQQTSKVTSAGTDAASEEQAIARVLLSLASLSTDAGTPAPASEKWVQTKDKVKAEPARELKTVNRRGGGAPIKASNKVLEVNWRKRDLARWTLTATIQRKIQVLQGFSVQLPLASKSSEGQVHPHLHVSAVSIPVPLLPELEAKLREVSPRTTSAFPSSKSTEKTKWLTKFFCSIGMMDDKSHPLSNVKRLKFVPEVWNQNGYRLIQGGCDGGGKPRIQHLDS